MFDLIKKAMFTGIGVMSLTKEKVEEVAKDFIEKGKLSEEEGKKLVDEMLERSEESKNEIKGQVESIVKATLMKLDVATKSDINEIRNELEELRRTVSKE